MSKGQILQDPFLNALRKDRIPVSIFLVNGIKLQGQIESFDQYAVLLKNTVSQMVYKHAISTIVPVRNPRTDNSLSGGNTGGGNYPTSLGFDRHNLGGNFPSERTGFAQRGGFTRTPPNQGYNNQGNHSQDGINHNNSNSQNSFSAFERSGSGFNQSFDRAAFEERGFDGQNFQSPATGLDVNNFDKKAFEDD